MRRFPPFLERQKAVHTTTTSAHPTPRDSSAARRYAYHFLRRVPAGSHASSYCQTSSDHTHPHPHHHHHRVVVLYSHLCWHHSRECAIRAQRNVGKQRTTPPPSPPSRFSYSSSPLTTPRAPTHTRKDVCSVRAYFGAGAVPVLLSSSSIVLPSSGVGWFSDLSA